MRVLITGASGLLGRAVCKAFNDAHHEVIGVAKTRAEKYGLYQLDLLDEPAVDAFVKQHQPQVIVHAAAERRPDVAKNNLQAARALNVDVTEHLAKIAKDMNIFLIYISTDYVFDGNNPPYQEDALPGPLNDYGKTKLDGEDRVLKTHSDSVILRIPILYGPAETPKESAVNELILIVKDTSAVVNMDHRQKRYPTHVADVARVILDIAVKRIEEKQTMDNIFHFSAELQLTKYEMCEIFAELLGVSINHINPITTATGTATRPNDCRLSTSRLRELEIDTGCVNFKEWWKTQLWRRK
ncbi:9400_t:CDS:10 [Paraglomus brasilianum]|uniref:9400_t:CDS:1 n=1 Tax=Paraglomus brasilianum TaxID=144538 RepID=A0A9N9AWQ3_9GLOM|nr:9400_t:CDS:10 [Paraglomus brasilianum]